MNTTKVSTKNNWPIAVGILIVLAVVFCKLPYWFAHPLAIYADQSVYLAMADLLLKGKKLYVDIFDFNPPLIIYLNTIPVVLANLINRPVIQVFNLSIYFLMLLSTTLTAAIFYANRQASDRYLFFPLLLAPVVCTQTQFYDFGQREHLFILLYFPFFVCRILRYQSGNIPTALAVTAGILAAIGVSLKPQFFLTALILEASLAWQWRSIKLFGSVENKICALLTAVYLLHFVLLGQQSLSVLFDQAWPIYSNGLSYFHIGFIEGLASLSSFSYPYYLLALAMSLAFALQGRSCWFLPATTFTLISLLSMLQAGSIWTYRGIPLQLGCLILIALSAGVGLEALFNYKARMAAPTLAALVCSAVLCFCQVWAPANTDYDFDLAQIGYSGRAPSSDLSLLVPSIIAHSQIGDRVIYIGRGVRPGYPSILQAHRHPGSRYLHGMILPMLVVCIEKDPSRFKPMLDLVIANYGQDVLTNKPKLIFIDDIFVAPLFAQRRFIEKYMTNYELIEHIDQAACTVYRSK